MMNPETEFSPEEPENQDGYTPEIGPLQAEDAPEPEPTEPEKEPEAAPEPIEMPEPIAEPEEPEEPRPLEEPEPPKPAKRSKKPFIILTSVFLTLAVLLVAVTVYVYLVIHPYGDFDKIMPNVYCAGLNLGGMTKQEAQSAIEDALRDTEYQVKLILPDGEYTFQPTQEGVTLNGSQVAQRAYDYGRSDTSAYGIYRAYQNAEKTEYRLTAETGLSYSQEDIETQTAQIAQDTYIAPTESTLDYDQDTHTVSVTLGTPGRSISQETIAAAVTEAFDSLDFSDITLEYDPVEIDMDATKALCYGAAETYDVDPVDPEITANETEHAIDLTMGTQGWDLDSRALYVLAQQAVAQQVYGTVSVTMTAIEPEQVDITEAYKELACEPTEPYYSGGTVYDGTYGYTLDWDTAVAEIRAANYGDFLEIPMTPVAPEQTADEIRAVLFRDRLSSFSSPYTSNADRTHNLELACKAINGTVINAGGTFSFNSVVGERTAAKGYRAATVYVGTDSKEELGGGICQVASTVYDAALYAEMEITSRDNHTFFVTYVEGGLDATVYWGSLDFCFRNSTDYPIRVNASVSGGYVTISIDGTKTNDHVVKLSSTKLSTTPYETVYEEDSSLPTGYQKETTSPYTGYTYEAYQYIYDGSGNLLATNYLGKSTYKKRDRVITVGTG
jgi:vancomycin resistance protein YoaR